MSSAVSVTLLLLLALFALLGVVVWLVIGIGLRISVAAAVRFALSNLLLAAGVVLVAQRTGEASYWFYPVGDMLTLLAISLFRGGLQILLQQRLTWAESAALLFGAGLAYATVPPGPESTLFHGVLFSLVSLYLAVRTLQSCYRGLHEEFGSLSTLIIALPFVLTAVAMAGRLLQFAIDPSVAKVSMQMTGGQVAPLLWTFIGLLLLLNVSLMGIAVGRLLINVRLLSERDVLTGLWNRRAMEHRIRKERARLNRGGQPYSLVIADLDYFKRLNDELGHAAGDAGLQHASTVLGRNMRTLDVLGRFGGEEFLVLMPMTGRIGATDAARRLQEALASTAFVWSGVERALTASFGVAEAEPAGDDETFRAADAALYRAKESGRNCVICAELSAPRVRT